MTNARYKGSNIRIVWISDYRVIRPIRAFAFSASANSADRSAQQVGNGELEYWGSVELMAKDGKS